MNKRNFQGLIPILLSKHKNIWPWWVTLYSSHISRTKTSKYCHAEVSVGVGEIKNILGFRLVCSFYLFAFPRTLSLHSIFNVVSIIYCCPWEKCCCFKKMLPYFRYFKRQSLFVSLVFDSHIHRHLLGRDNDFPNQLQYIRLCWEKVLPCSIIKGIMATNAETLNSGQVDPSTI